MSIWSLTVAVILDPDFGERTRSIAAEMPVWIRDSPANRAVVEALRRSGSAITCFQASSADSDREILASLLSDIELHHGPLGQEPPWAALQVHGLKPTPELDSLLHDLGFGRPESISDGFRCTKLAS